MKNKEHFPSNGSDSEILDESMVESYSQSNSIYKSIFEKQPSYNEPK